MSAQIIELLVFAVIAFFIINKLIATLGVTSDDDPAKNKTYFGEAVIKDVTYTANTQNNLRKKNEPTAKELKILEELIVAQNLTPIVDGMEMLKQRLPSFQPINFINNAKAAFQMIIEAAFHNRQDELVQLIDKRFLDNFKEIAITYGGFFDSTAIKAQFSEIYMFGNNAFIKILFQGKNITDKIQVFKEEWTFTRSTKTDASDWYLCNIEKYNN